VTVIALALVYCLYYAALSVATGAFPLRLLRAEAAAAPREPREILSPFLLGTGFAPCVAGLLHLTFLIVFAGFPPLALAGLHLAVAAAALFAFRGECARARAAFAAMLRDAGGGGKVGVAVFCAAFCFMAWMAGQAAIRPIWHGDTLTYGVEAKALRDERTYAARFVPTPFPNVHNYIRGNDHPLTYVGLLASGLAFSPERTQDFGMRVALQLQNLTLLLVLAGLALRYGGFAAVLAPTLLFFAAYLGALLTMSAREVFRIIPMLLAFGFMPGRRAPLTWRGGRTLLLAAAFAFLWNSHSSSLMVAPMLYGCLALALPGLRSKAVLGVWLVLGFFVGANHFLVAYEATGHPLGLEMVGMDVARLGAPTTWTPPPPPRPGLAALPSRLANQYANDGLAAGVAAVALVGLCVAAVRRRRLPAPVLAAGIFTAVLQMQVLGLFDWIYPGFGAAYYEVHRFRFSLYPPAAFLAAYFLVLTVNRLWPARKSAVLAGLCAACLAGGAAFALARWEKNTVAVQVVRRDDVLSLLAVKQSCWWEVEKRLRQEKDGDKRLIVTDAPYIPWYYTDDNVMFLGDERLNPARRTTDPDKAAAELDRMGVAWIVLNKANALSNSALEQVIRSEAFDKAIDCVFDEAYRRQGQ
jgi:hypothetical protein